MILISYDEFSSLNQFSSAISRLHRDTWRDGLQGDLIRSSIQILLHYPYKESQPSRVPVDGPSTPSKLRTSHTSARSSHISGQSRCVYLPAMIDGSSMEFPWSIQPVLSLPLEKEYHPGINYRICTRRVKNFLSGSD